SLKALRQYAKQSHASDPCLGFGNPLLAGDDPSRARLAVGKRCLTTKPTAVAALSKTRLVKAAVARGPGGLADVADLRRWNPLPQAADELCDVAQNLGAAPTTHVYIGARATETRIKQLSEDGTLAKYRIVHFATHGAVAGDLLGTSEPGLVLTPPDQPTE